MTAHSSSDDPTRYQAPDWMARAFAHDPYRRLEQLIDALGLLTADARADMAAEADAQVKQAVQEAESVGPPTPDSLTTDVWATGPRPEGPGANEA